MMDEDEVKRYLVTCIDADLLLLAYRLPMCNFIETRERTTMFTCMSGDALDVVEAAQEMDVTLEEIKGAGDNEEHHMIHQGTLPGWRKG